MYTVETIQDRIEMKAEAKSSVVLFADGFKVIGLGFLAGQTLAQHSSPTAVFLFVETGNIDFTMGGIKTTMKAGNFVSIPAKEKHEIMAIEDSRILLTKGV